MCGHFGSHVSYNTWTCSGGFIINTYGETLGKNDGEERSFGDQTKDTYI